MRNIQFTLLIGALLVSLGLPAAARAANSVELGIVSPGDTLWSNVPAEVAIFIENDVEITAFALGFIFSSPNGATWTWAPQPDGYRAPLPVFTKVSGSRADFNWDFLGTNQYSFDGISPDSILTGGVVIFPPGLLPGPREHCFSLHLVPGDISPEVWRFICIDSAFMPPAGPFIFTSPDDPEINPDFGGPYYFIVKECTIDHDSDDICDYIDNCPGVPNAGQADADDDGVGDACDNCVEQVNADQADSDSDGYGDACDNCPGEPNADQTDTDDDGVGDVCDNCAADPNSDQLDSDEDGFGDVCDNCPEIPNPQQQDFDNDGFGNYCDNCPIISNPDQIDTDGNGIGDACENIVSQCGDVNIDGWINIADVVYLIDFIFRFGPPPCQPGDRGQ